LVALASGALKLIKQSCEALNEGRALVKEAVEEVGGAIDNIQGAKGDILGLWGKIIGLFGGKFTTPTAPTDRQVSKPTKKVKQKKAEFDENAIFAEVGKSLTEFFKAYNALDLYIKEEEEKSRHVFDPESDNSANAINRVLAQLQMEKLNLELREYMVYMVPPEMKDLYGRVNKMLGQIANEQELARMDELTKKRQATWRRRQVIEKIKHRVLIGGVTTLVILWAWLMILTMTLSTSS
jgi:hypothetical protein